jgi:flagellar motility protein MotE (MotC chaperone)
MIGYFRDLRLIPIAMVASACLLVLLAADLVLGHISDGDLSRSRDTTIIHATPGGLRVMDERRTDRRVDDRRLDGRRGDDQRTDDRRSDDRRGDSKRSWSQQMFNFPNAKAPVRERDDLSLLPTIAPLSGDKPHPEVTGALPAQDGDKGAAIAQAAEPEAGKMDGAKSDGSKSDGSKSDGTKSDGTKTESTKAGSANGPQDPPPSPNGKVVVVADASASPSAAERAILERLQQRRQELEKRARELDIREGLIADAERRVESKLLQVKEGQQQLAAAVQKKDEAEAARFKGLVTMYENMKPRDAAKIFDRLEVNVLLQVASLMSPRAMSEILALMSPDRAQQLTVELANRAQGSGKNPGSNLPKIEGRPTGQ